MVALADEYGAAQERVEVGLQIHDAREVRDAGRVAPRLLNTREH
jgi:hypothetical protein